MKKTTKAVLLSALIYPGSGHFYLKRHLMAIALAGTATLMLYFLLSNIIRKANLIAEQILNGNIQPDITTIIELVNQQTTGDEFLSLNTATAILIISWVVGILDIYRVRPLAE